MLQGFYPGAIPNWAPMRRDGAPLPFHGCVAPGGWGPWAREAPGVQASQKAA